MLKASREQVKTVKYLQNLSLYLSLYLSLQCSIQIEKTLATFSSFFTIFLNSLNSIISVFFTFALAFSIYHKYLVATRITSSNSYQKCRICVFWKSKTLKKYGIISTSSCTCPCYLHNNREK